MMLTAASSPAPTAPTTTSLRLERDRFVALAFCWGDLLFELDVDGRIVYATGAIEPFLGLPAENLVEKSLESIVVAGERASVRTLLAGASGRKRIETSSLQLNGASGPTPPLSVAGYQLEDLNGHYFLAMRACPPTVRTAGFGRRSRDGATGLYDAPAFIDMVTSQLASDRRIEGERCVSLIMLPGYGNLRERLLATAENELLSRIGASLRAGAIDGASAARIGPDRYSLLHRADLDIDGLKGEIGDLTRSADSQAIGTNVEAATVEIDDVGGGAVGQSLTYAISRFQAMDGDVDALASFSTSFSAVAQEAVSALGDIGTLIAEGMFRIMLQPILDARSGAAHAYAVTVRLPA